MRSNQLALTLVLPESPPEPESPGQALVRLTLAELSPNTQRAYSRHLNRFVAGSYAFNESGIRLFLGNESVGHSKPHIEQCRAAILHLARKARDAGLCSDDDLERIQSIKLKLTKGNRAGRWLTLAELKQLYSQPDTSTIIGKRDKALLALLAGCGLRREESCALKWSNWQKREGRWMLIDVLGKGNKHRSVPVPQWAADGVLEWYTISTLYGKLDSDPMLCAVSRSGVLGNALTHDAIWFIVRKYSLMADLVFSPHDLRRTLAKLMHNAGAGLEQIQYMLGHESITTTMKYVGMCLELAPGKAGVDKIEL